MLFGSHHSVVENNGRNVFQLWDNNGRLGMIVYSPLLQGGYGVSFGSSNIGEGSGAVAWLADAI
jgi:hypothetical protein